MHQHLAGRVVGPVELIAVVDPADATPGSAVERLHEHRKADPTGHLVQVERQVVGAGRVGPLLMIEGVLVRHQHGGWDVESEPDHRAVGGVLLHGLERERIVEQIGAVHQRGLLQPLPGVVVPPGQPVDHHIVPDRVPEVERLDRDSLGVERVVRVVVPDASELSDQRFEGSWPVVLGAEQESDQVGGGVGGCGHDRNLAGRRFEPRWGSAHRIEKAVEMRCPGVAPTDRVVRIGHDDEAGRILGSRQFLGHQLVVGQVFLNRATGQQQRYATLWRLRVHLDRRGADSVEVGEAGFLGIRERG